LGYKHPSGNWYSKGFRWMKSFGGITISDFVSHNIFLEFGVTGNTDKRENTTSVAHSLPMCVIVSIIDMILYYTLNYVLSFIIDFKSLKFE